MKKKIGFIDLFIDEWHADNYPAWFHAAARKDEFELGYAWEEAPFPGRRPLAQWCSDFAMTPARSIEEVVEKSDCVCVLAPGNPEVHYRLAEIPLQSGKPVYVDKPFAPDGETAKRIFALAEKHHTPLMSSSALRFGNGILAAKKELFATERPIYVQTTGGGGTFDEYGIHQLEMIVSLLGPGAKRVMQRRSCIVKELLIDYDDGRFASSSYQPGLPFSLTAANEHASRHIDDCDRMFENLIDAMLDFFATEKSSIDGRETMETAAILGKSLEALKTPGEWLSL